MRDKITPLSGPPGHSLTDTPRKWAWDKPPVYSDPDEAVDFVLDSLETESRKNDMIKLMLAGISIEEIVTQIGFKGFMEGYYTPDVAELIKPPISLYLLGVADDAGFKPIFYAGDPEGKRPDSVSDETFFGIMKQRNPELFAAMIEKANEEERMVELAKTDIIQSNIDMAMREQQIENESFIGVPVEQEEPMMGEGMDVVQEEVENEVA
jgi:hypothetical protein